MDMVEIVSTTASNGSRTNGANKEINKLLSAAVVSAKFRQLLLTDPRAALQAGYNGQSFNLDEETRALVLSITADTLPEFAAHLTRQTANVRKSSRKHF